MSPESGSIPTARPRSVPLVGDEPAMQAWAEALVEQARTQGVELTGDNGLLTALVQRVLQTGLNVELTEHLGYERHAVEGRGTGNSRNGSYPKTVSTGVGKVTIDVPRDRNATFDPVTVARGQRRLNGLNANVKRPGLCGGSLGLRANRRSRTGHGRRRFVGGGSGVLGGVVDRS